MNMNIHVNPVVSDGQFTIGYDADGVAGQWPGNMAERTDYFMPARIGAEFSDGNEVWDAAENGDEIVWRDGAGNWTPIAEVLRQYGDR